MLRFSIGSFYTNLFILSIQQAHPVASGAPSPAAAAVLLAAAAAAALLLPPAAAVGHGEGGADAAVLDQVVDGPGKCFLCSNVLGF